MLLREIWYLSYQGQFDPINHDLITQAAPTVEAIFSVTNISNKIFKFDRMRWLCMLPLDWSEGKLKFTSLGIFR